MSPHVLRRGALTTTYWLHDTFDVGTTTQLDQHTPDIAPSGAWADTVGNHNTDYVVEPGLGVQDGPNPSTVAPFAAYPAKVGPDVRAKLTVNLNDTEGTDISDRVYLIIRDENGFGGFGDGHGYWIRVCESGHCMLTKFVNGTSTTLANNGESVIISPPLDTSHTITLEVIGSTIRFLWDDTLIYEETDTDITAAGYIRFCDYGANATFEELTVEEL